MGTGSYVGGIIIDLQKKEKSMELHAMLQEADKNGVLLYLEGEPASPEEIVDRYCLNEDSVYMPDYVLDNAGKLSELRYDKVKNQ